MFWLAIFAGLAVSIPPGPLGALCVIRTLRGGLLAGLAIGLAVATIDGLVFGAIAALGSHAISDLAPWIRRLAAGLVAVALFLLGWRVMREAGRKPSEEKPEDRAGSFKPAASAMLIALGTPGTLPVLLAIFATLQIDDARIGAAGVFCGGLLGWSTLCLIAHCFRSRAVKALHLLDYACGALLWLGAVAAACFSLLGAHGTPGLR